MKYYGQFDPPVDKTIYERYFLNKSNGFFIECGAFNGIDDSSCYIFEKYFGWNGINIEASECLYNKLCEKRPDSTNIFGALANYDGEITFTKTYMGSYESEFGNGSCKHTEQHIDHLKQFNVLYKDFTVNCFTYESLIKKYNIQTVDLFVLDVEGFEDSVIKGMVNSNVLPKVLCVEHTNCDWETVNNLLLSMDYKKDYEEHVNSFFIRN